MDFDLGFFKVENWYLHQGGTHSVIRRAADTAGLLITLSTNQQLRFSLQWIGIVAEENEFWQVPHSGRLLPERSKIRATLTTLLYRR